MPSIFFTYSLKDSKSLRFMLLFYGSDLHYISYLFCLHFLWNGIHLPEFSFIITNFLFQSLSELLTYSYMKTIPLKGRKLYS